MDKFTIEEIHLMCIYDTSSTAVLMREMHEGLPHVDEPELLELMKGVLVKLGGMTDDEFATLDIIAEEYIEQED